MKYNRKPYAANDFIKIRDFLKETYKSNHTQHNWLIDRWNFAKYVSQSFHKTTETWPSTVGIWVDDNESIVAVVNSEGENKGEAFLQLNNADFTKDDFELFLNHCEKYLSVIKEPDSTRLLNLRVSEKYPILKQLLADRSYKQQEWKEPTSSLHISDLLPVNLPEGLRLSDANGFNDEQRGFAHGRAFGYYKDSEPDDNDAEIAFTNMRMAPDYCSDLDIAALNENNDVVAFATIWYDEYNQIGILEPVGTVPEYRKKGIGKAVISECINRARARGANTVYVGSDQPFYISCGFKLDYSLEIWQKQW